MTAILEDPTAFIPINLIRWAARHGIEVTCPDEFSSTLMIGLSESPEHAISTGEGPPRRFRFLAPSTERPEGIMQVDDGHFDRWANSVGATTALPLTEEAFDKALAEIIRWSEIRMKNPKISWILPEIYDARVERIIQDYPHVVIVHHDHLDKNNYDHDAGDYPPVPEALEFLETIPGDHERVARGVFFKRDIEAAMFSLAYGSA